MLRQSLDSLNRLNMFGNKTEFGQFDILVPLIFFSIHLADGMLAFFWLRQHCGVVAIIHHLTP